MKEIADVLNAAKAPRNERLEAQRASLKKRNDIWKKIQDGRFPESYESTDD